MAANRPGKEMGASAGVAAEKVSERVSPWNCRSRKAAKLVCGAMSQALLGTHSLSPNPATSATSE